MSFTVSHAADCTTTMKFQTYNVWNYENGPNWEWRKMGLTEIIKKEAADVIGFQELRNGVTTKQYEDLATLLPDFPYRTELVVGEVHANAQGSGIEGIAIFSRYPFIDQSFYKLPLAQNEGGEDSNHRVVQQVLIQAPNSCGKQEKIRIFNTHLSYDSRQQLSNIQEVVSFADRYDLNSEFQIIMGDLNLFNDFKPPEEYLKSKGFVNMWLAFKQKWGAADVEGWTFSTLQDTITGATLLDKYPDRIYGRGGSGRTVDEFNVHTAGGEKINGLYASDHKSLLATVQFIAKGDAPIIPNSFPGIFNINGNALEQKKKELIEHHTSTLLEVLKSQKAHIERTNRINTGRMAGTFALHNAAVGETSEQWHWDTPRKKAPANHQVDIYQKIVVLALLCAVCAVVGGLWYYLFQEETGPKLPKSNFRSSASTSSSASYGNAFAPYGSSPSYTTSYSSTPAAQPASNYIPHVRHQVQSSYAQPAQTSSFMAESYDQAPSSSYSATSDYQSNVQSTSDKKIFQNSNSPHSFQYSNSTQNFQNNHHTQNFQNQNVHVVAPVQSRKERAD